jgi:hypothetical protein
VINVFYYIFVGILGFAAFCILINCIITFIRTKCAERDLNVIESDRCRAAEKAARLSCKKENERKKADCCEEEEE